MGLKEDWQNLIERMRRGLVDKTHLNLNLYSGDLSAHVGEDGSIDWPSVRKSSAAGADSDVSLVISAKVDALDGDTDVFFTNDPQLLARKEEFMGVFDRQVGAAMRVRDTWARFFGSLAALAEKISPL